jgi:hypothetical protein
MQDLTKVDLLSETTLTESFGDTESAVIPFRDGGEIVLFLDWAPGDEDGIEITEFCALGDYDTDETYRSVNVDHTEMTGLSYGEPRLHRFNMCDFDEGDDPWKIAFSVRPRGNRVYFRFRYFNNDPAYPALDPGDLAVSYARR